MSQMPQMPQMLPRMNQGLELLARHWVTVVGVAALGLLAFLSIANQAVFGDTGRDCLKASFLTLEWAPAPCTATLQAMVDVGAVNDHGGPAALTFGALVEWMRNGWPRGLVWVDNLFVDFYTVFLIAACCAAYRYCTTIFSDPIVFWRAAITVTCALALLGAIVDHSENFWLLAHMRRAAQAPPDYLNELEQVSAISAWKFRLFAFNLLVLLGWGVAVRWRRGTLARRAERLRHLSRLQSLDELGRTLGIVPQQWPSALNYMRGSTTAFAAKPPVWQAILFEHFLYKVLPARGRPRYSFSAHAVNTWLAIVVKDLGGRDWDQCCLEVQRYLNSLSQRGYLLARGRRFEITCSGFSEDPDKVSLLELLAEPQDCEGEKRATSSRPPAG